MKDSVELILKVLLASALISVGIKSVGPMLPIPGTSAVAIAIVLTPTVVMTLLLGWRLQRDRT
jgi:hypothetical protein